MRQQESTQQRSQMRNASSHKSAISGGPQTATNQGMLHSRQYRAQQASATVLFAGLEAGAGPAAKHQVAQVNTSKESRGHQQRKRSAITRKKEAGGRAHPGPQRLAVEGAAGLNDLVAYKGQPYGQAIVEAGKKHECYLERFQIKKMEHPTQKSGQHHNQSNGHDPTKFKKRKVSQQPKMALLQQYITAQLQHQELQTEKHPKRKGGMLQQHHSQVNLPRNRQQQQNNNSNMEVLQPWKSNKQDLSKGRGDRLHYQNQFLDASIAKISHETPSPSIHQMTSLHQQLNKQLQSHVLQMEDIIASSNTVLSHSNNQLLPQQSNIQSTLNTYCPQQKIVKGYKIKKQDVTSQVAAGKASGAGGARRAAVEEPERAAADGRTFKITQQGRLLDEEVQDEVEVLYGDPRPGAVRASQLSAATEETAQGEQDSQKSKELAASKRQAAGKQSAIRKKNTLYHLERHGSNKDQYYATSPQILHTDLVFLGDKAMRDSQEAAQKQRAVSKARPQLQSQKDCESVEGRANIKVGELAPEGLQQFYRQNYNSEQSSNVELIEINNEDHLQHSKDESLKLKSLQSQTNNIYQHRRQLVKENTAPIVKTSSKPSPGQTISKQVLKDSLNTESNVSIQPSLAVLTTGQQRSETPSRQQDSQANAQFPMLPNIRPQHPSITHQTAALSKNHSLCDILYQSQAGARPTAIMTLKTSSKQQLRKSSDAKLPAATAQPSLSHKHAQEDKIHEISAERHGLSDDSEHNLYQDAKLKDYHQIVLQQNNSGAAKTIELQDGEKNQITGRETVYNSSGLKVKENGQYLKPDFDLRKNPKGNADMHDAESIGQKQPLNEYNDKEESPAIAQLYHDTLVNKLIDQDIQKAGRATNDSRSKTIGQGHSLRHSGPNNGGSRSGVNVRMNQKQEQELAEHVKRDSLMGGQAGANRQKSAPGYDSHGKMYKKMLTSKNNIGQHYQLHHDHASRNQSNVATQPGRKRANKESKSQPTAQRQIHLAQSSTGQSGRNHYHPAGPLSPRSRTAEHDSPEQVLRSNSGLHGGGSVGPEKERSPTITAAPGPNISTHSHQHQHHHYHIDLNIQQVNNILINYGIMPMSYERPAGNGGPNGQAAGSRAAGHSSASYGISRSQIYGAKSAMKGKESHGFLNRSHFHNLPTRGRNHHGAVHAHSQHIAIRPIINHLACRQIYLGNHNFIEPLQPQHSVHTSKKSKRYTQHTSIKLQNKMKSRHDKLQSQVQNLCQSRPQGLQGPHVVYATDPNIAANSPQALHKATSLDLLSSLPHAQLPPHHLFVSSTQQRSSRLQQQRMPQPYDHFERANLGAALPPDLTGYLQVEERDARRLEAAADAALAGRKTAEAEGGPDDTCGSRSEETMDHLKAPGASHAPDDEDTAARDSGSKSCSHNRKRSSKGSKVSNSRIDKRESLRESSGRSRLKSSVQKASKKDQSFGDAVVINVVQDKVKSLTMGKRQVQLNTSEMKKRRESNHLKGIGGDRAKRQNIAKSYKDGGGSPPNAHNSRDNNYSELKLLYDSCMKTQEPGGGNVDTGLLPQSIDLSMKNGGASAGGPQTTSHGKFVRQGTVSRERSYANVLKNQEYRIKQPRNATIKQSKASQKVPFPVQAQLDKQSKRANFMVDHINDGGVMSSNVHRVVAGHATEQSNAHQMQGRSRAQTDYHAAAAAHKDQAAKVQGIDVLGPKPQISDFEVFEVIGTGNFGRVCKAYNNKMQRVSALKIIKKESIIAMKQVDHVIGEREVLKHLTLQHASDRAGHGPKSQSCPFIIRIYSSFQDEEHLYLELEYVEGCTLLSQINKRNEDVTNNMPFYAAEALLTLQFLHRQNIIYRDLKPENIVLSMRERGHMKLVDFGFARQLKYYGQKCLTNCGTPQYIAPEIIRGAGHSFEVDIWCLGVLIADIVSGQTPFQAENTKQSYEKIMLCQPSYPRQVTQTQRDLLNRIFVSDPSMRIKLQEIKKHAVFKDFNFERTMNDFFLNEVAPFIPQSALFNEIALRTSSDTQMQKANKQNKLLAALFSSSPDKGGGGLQQRQLSFDNEHFQKFLKQDKKERLLEGRKDTALGPRVEDQSPKRKRQNPLGDFKFKKIDEYF